MNRKYLSAVMLLIASPAAFADYTDTNKSISMIGAAQGSPDVGYFSLAGGLTGYPSCPYGFIYVDSSTNGGKTQQAMIIAAKLSEKPVTIVYYINTNSLCYLRQLYM